MVSAPTDTPPTVTNHISHIMITCLNQLLNGLDTKTSDRIIVIREFPN